jgi:hypothetical protein
VIGDWATRFRLANYTQEQRRFVKLSQDKLEEWFDVYRKTDWINQDNSDGVSTECRTSDRKLNTMKVSKVLPYKNTEIFKLLNANQYRQSYDVNISQAYTIKKICANTSAIYQQSKKIIVVSPRDFVLVLFTH